MTGDDVNRALETLLRVGGALETCAGKAAEGDAPAPIASSPPADELVTLPLEGAADTWTDGPANGEEPVAAIVGRALDGKLQC